MDGELVTGDWNIILLVWAPLLTSEWTSVFYSKERLPTFRGMCALMNNWLGNLHLMGSDIWWVIRHEIVSYFRHSQQTLFYAFPATAISGSCYSCKALRQLNVHRTLVQAGRFWKPNLSTIDKVQWLKRGSLTVQVLSRSALRRLLDDPRCWI